MAGPVRRREPRRVLHLERLDDWVESRGVTLVVLEDNHDRGRLVEVRGSGRTRRPASCTVDGWTIAHGHRPIAGERTISGHHHPVPRAEGLTAACFLAGPGRIDLPAFSANAAGRDVRSGPVPSEWMDEARRCIASTGSDLLDFGPRPALRRLLGASP